MLWKATLAVSVLLAHDATAQNINVGKLLRFSCSQLVIERTDPLVNPGVKPSPHTHQIVSDLLGVEKGLGTPYVDVERVSSDYLMGMCGGFDTWVDQGVRTLNDELGT